MRRIDAGPVPGSVTEARRARTGFEAISSDPAVRAALRTEQRGLCAYCERVLRALDGPRPHHTRIEHFHPQHPTTPSTTECSGAVGAPLDEAPIAWNNLLLCCDGHEYARRSRSNFTCDKAKGAVDICACFRNPKTVSKTVETLLDIHDNGTVEPAGWLPAEARHVVDSVLNLNHSDLVAGRAARIRAIRNEIVAVGKQRHGLSPATRETIAAKLRTQADQEHYEFPSVNLRLAARLTSR